MNIIFILNGALKHYRHHSSEQVFYYNEKRDILYPLNKEIDYDKPAIVIDSNITTGRTVKRVIKQLKLEKCQEIIIEGNARTRYAEKIIDVELEDPAPEKDKYIIAFAGKPASLKSFIAKSLSVSHNIPVIQIGKELKKRVCLGKYGEELMKKERVNPFLVGELLYPVLSKMNDSVIIIDGIKNIESLTLISLATRRATFLFYVQINESTRKKALKYRSDDDDKFERERELMFKKNLEKLKEQSYSVIDMDDWSTFRELSDVLDLLGYSTSHICGFPNPFQSKVPILELYKRNTEKLSKREIRERFLDKCFHKSYLERIRDYRLSLVKKKIIVLTASAFRIVDDILDEHNTRDYKLTYWKEHGITQSIFDASLMTAKAWILCKKIGYDSEFKEMFREVIDAVRYEIDVEEFRASYENISDWLRAAKRETAFREFIALLIDKNNRELREEFRKKAIRAQAKDDLVGKEKRGRENTDDMLMRPLFKKEWCKYLDKI